MSEDDTTTSRMLDEYIPPLPDDFKPNSTLLLPRFMITPGFETLSLIILGLHMTKSGAASRAFLIQTNQTANTEYKDFKLGNLMRNTRTFNLSDELLYVQSLMLGEEVTVPRWDFHDRNENLLNTISNGLQYCCGLTIIKQESLDMAKLQEELSELDHGVIVLAEGKVSDIPLRFLGPFFYGGKHLPKERQETDTCIERGYARLSWAVGSLDGVMTLFVLMRTMKNGKVHDYMCCISDGSLSVRNLGEDVIGLGENVRVYALCYEYNENEYFPDEMYNARQNETKPGFRRDVDQPYREFLENRLKEWENKNWTFDEYVCECLRFPELFVLETGENRFDLALSVGLALHYSGNVDKVVATTYQKTVSQSLSDSDFITIVRDYAAFTEWVYALCELADPTTSVSNLIETVDKYFAFIPLRNQRLIDFAMTFLYQIYREKEDDMDWEPVTDRIHNNIISVLDEKSFKEFFSGDPGPDTPMSYEVEFGGNCPKHIEPMNPRCMVLHIGKLFKGKNLDTVAVQRIKFGKDFLSYRERIYNNFSITF